MKTAKINQLPKLSGQRIHVLEIRLNYAVVLLAFVATLCATDQDDYCYVCGLIPGAGSYRYMCEWF